MAHHHEHHSQILGTGHHQHKEMSSAKLLWVTVLNFSITVVQVIGGLISNSLSLLSDALHNLGDTSAIFIAFLAGKRSQKSADEKNTFGYKRVEILAALFNAVVLIVICVFLFFEAYKRLINPEPIKGAIMLIVATFGLLANVISVLVLQKDKNHNLNVKAAYLHLMGDTLSSVAVIIGGIAIWLWNITWIDPLITVLVGVYIIYHTWGVVKETIDILMQATPHNINIAEIKKAVESIDDVEDIHHVHVWKLNDEQIHLEAHINLKNNVDMVSMMKIKQEIEEIIRDNFGINHITLQIGYNCCINGEISH
ncbi:MAG: cation diffusion facilitator family transporter [Lentimicrobiaceae bacterium]|nr:cation diffusion facilitator family transporter [Lentimicrobiaceae bacterium]